VKVLSLSEATFMIKTTQKKKEKKMENENHKMKNTFQK